MGLNRYSNLPKLSGFVEFISENVDNSNFIKTMGLQVGKILGFCKAVLCSFAYPCLQTTKIMGKEKP